MEIGPAERVIGSPHHPYTAALVSVSPTPDPPEEAGAPVRTILVGETPDAANVPAGCRFHPRCPLVFDRCRTEAPPLFDVGGGQAAACWLAEGGRSLPVLPTTSPLDAIPAPPGGEGTAAPAAGSSPPERFPGGPEG
jgi:oligopeptide/dipeptide ABC transporter ATP-binding protein